MKCHLLLYELRLIGWGVLAGPPLALVVLVVLAGLSAALGAPQHVNRILSASLDVLPLVGGIGAASVLARDQAVELQLTLPRSFRATIMRRFGLVLGWSIVFTLVSTAALEATGKLVWPINLWSEQLIWLAPLLWLAGIGALGSLGARGVAVGAGVVGVIWIFEQVFAQIFALVNWLQPFWLFVRWSASQSATWYLNRVILLATALIFLFIAYIILGRPERLLTGEKL